MAIDQASVDLVNQAPALPNTAIPDDRLEDGDKFEILHGVDWRVQLRYAEELGLGSRDYELVEL